MDSNDYKVFYITKLVSVLKGQTKHIDILKRHLKIF